MSRLEELRRELDAAAALHREVKARLEAELKDYRNGRTGALIAEFRETNTRLTSELAFARTDAQGCRDAGKTLLAENTRLQGGLATMETILAALVENVIGNARFRGGHRFVGHVGIEHWKAALDWYDARLAASDKSPDRQPAAEGKPS